MPVLEFTEKHNLPKNEAKLRLTGIVDSLVKEYSELISKPQIAWEGYTAYFSYQLMGKMIKGVMEVYDKKVILRIEYFLFLRPFKSIVLKETRKRAKALLGKENKYRDVI
jgi:hypothetical protein